MDWSGVLARVSLCVYMMTSSNGNIFRVTGHLCGEFTGPRWIPHTKASHAELWCFFDLRPNKQLSKQWWSWWFETPSRPLWRHRNVSSKNLSNAWIHVYIWSRRYTHYLIYYATWHTQWCTKQHFYHYSLTLLAARGWRHNVVRVYVTIATLVSDI